MKTMSLLSSQLDLVRRDPERQARPATRADASPRADGPRARPRDEERFELPEVDESDEEDEEASEDEVARVLMPLLPPPPEPSALDLDGEAAPLEVASPRRNPAGQLAKAPLDPDQPEAEPVEDPAATADEFAEVAGPRKAAEPAGAPSTRPAVTRTEGADAPRVQHPSATPAHAASQDRATPAAAAQLVASGVTQAVDAPDGLPHLKPPTTTTNPEGDLTITEVGGLPSLDDLDLRATERVLGVGPSNHASGPASATAASRDMAGEVADAVSRLLADASDDTSLMRFRTESGQTFLAQASLDAARGLDLRLISDDPTTRHLLGQRLDDVRAALARSGLGQANVSVDRDTSRGGHRDARPEEPADLAVEGVRPRRPSPFQGPAELREPGRLHLII